MQEIFFINSIEQFSYLAIFLFAISAGYAIPVPEEIILLIVGYMVRIQAVHFFPAVLVACLAFIIGDNILFRLTLKNNKHVTKLVHEVLSMKTVIKHREFLQKHVGWAIFICRFFPFLRFLGPVFAGYVKAKKRTFVIFDTLAILIYAPLLVWAGYSFHEYFSWMFNQITRVRHAGVILLWIVVGLLITRVVDYIFRKSDVEKNDMN